MRTILAVSALLVFLCVSVGSADLVKSRKLEKEKIGPLSARYYVVEAKENSPAKIIVSGNYQSVLGLYVYDADGNCVAHDDKTTPQVSDDLNVDWLPATTGRYQVSICNGGFEVNTYNMAMR